MVSGLLFFYCLWYLNETSQICWTAKVTYYNEGLSLLSFQFMSYPPLINRKMFLTCSSFTIWNIWMKLHRYVDHQRLHIVTKDVISLSISVLLLFRHYISHKITFGAPSSGGVLCSAYGAFIVFVWFNPWRPSQKFFKLCRNWSSWFEPVLSKDYGIQEVKK